MTKNRSQNDKLSGLHKRAEDRLKLENTPIDGLSNEDVRTLAHELRVHQIELEMQNSELRKDQTIITESRKKYSDLYNFAPVGYFTLDEKGLILDVNLTAARMLGNERSSLIKKTMSVFVVKEDQDILYLHRKKVIETKSKQSCELRILNIKDNQQFYAQLESKLAFDHEDKSKRMLVIINDITERKRMEEKLIEAEHEAETSNLAKLTFLANMGHELRTPLNAINGFTELLKDTISDKINDKQKRYLDNIYSSGKHLLEMINNILDLSEAATGKLELDIDEFSLPNLLNNMVARTKSSADIKNIDIRINLDENVSTIKADEVKVSKVVSTILDNAVKFTPAGGEIKIEVASIADKVQVSIADTGIGVNPENKDTIFNAFEQADGSYKRKFGGTGIGLAIAREFVEMHGGKIWLKTDTGSGSVFRFVIPYETKHRDERLVDSAVGGLKWEHFLKHVERVLSFHKRKGSKFGLLWLDLKHKGVGLDYLLFIENLKDILRKNDIFGLGKTEGCYYILLIDADKSMVKNVSGKISNIFREKGYSAKIKAVIYPEEGGSKEELMNALRQKQDEQ